MSKMSWSYLSGFFDADGSIYQERHYWRMNFSNYEADVIDDIHGFLIANGVNAKRYDKTKYEKGHEVRINTQIDIKRVAKHILRFSSIGYKREKMLQARRDIK